MAAKKTTTRRAKPKAAAAAVPAAGSAPAPIAEVLRVLAQALQKELARRGRNLPALVQVHATGEATKHGCAVEDLDAFVATVRAQCPAIELHGLMAMGPLEGDPAPVFARVQQLLQGLRRSTGLALPELSMGMSGDLEVAVAHGATMVRVGTDVFGARAPAE